MLELKEFIKNLKILYIEEKKESREELSLILSTISNNVDVLENNSSGFLKYQEKHREEKDYDIIILDISMSQLNGIEIVKKIRENDENVSIIFTTRKDEQNILLETIKLDISSFLTKPIDSHTLYENIQKIAKKLYFKKQFYLKQKELETYTNIIESVAVISKTDLKGIITYVDEAFCQVTGYTKEELIGQNHNIVRHPENPKEVYKNLWDTIQKGKIWEGKVRNIDKNGEPWYAKSTIFPIFDDNHNEIIEYIAIRFIITEEHDEKRELNNRLIKDTIHHKKELATLQKENEELFLQIGSANGIIDNLKDKIEKLMQNKNKLLAQISEYEESSLNNQSDRLTILKKKNDELQAKIKFIEKLKEDKEKQQQSIRELEHKIEVKDSIIESYKKNITQYKVQLGELRKSKQKTEEKKGFFG